MSFTKDKRLGAYVLHPTSKHSHTFIYLHGFGEIARDKYVGYEDSFYFQNRVPFPGLKVIALEASTLAISCHPGYKGPAWYDYLTDRKGNAEDLLDEKTLKNTAKRVHKLIREESKKVGSENVLLGGMSQGCGTALHCAATLPEPLAIGGFLGLLGHVLSDTPVDALAGKSRSPVCLGPMMFFNHDRDNIMKLPWVGETFARLASSKVPRVSLFVREGTHICSDEDSVYIAEFLSAILPPPPLPDMLSELYEIDSIAEEPKQKTLVFAKTKPKTTTSTKKDVVQKTITRQTSTSSSTRKGRR
jgi:predicted esterase